MNAPASTFTGLFEAPGAEQRIVVFVKTTYVLPQHGPLRRAADDLPLTVDTVSEGPDQGFPVGCTLAETDLWELKPCTDVVVRGHVQALGGRPITSMNAGVSVAGREKWIRVFGDRRAVYRDGRLCFTDPEPFTAIELSWRRAYGGVDLTVPHPEPESLSDVFKLFCPESHPGAYPRNPAGRGWVINDVPDAIHGMALPNFETPAQLLSPAHLIVGDRRLWPRAPIPAGFGWWRQAWFPRSALLGLSTPEFIDDPRGFPEVQMGWLHAEQVSHPEPDPSFQSGASAGLRFAKLGCGERLVLHGFSPAGPIDTSLPSSPPAIIVAFDGEPLASRLSLATVELLPDAGLANLVWVAHAAPPIRLPKKLPRPGQLAYDMLEGVVVLVDGERVANATISLREPT